jgi:YD repeat-containing protein
LTVIGVVIEIGKMNRNNDVIAIKEDISLGLTMEKYMKSIIVKLVFATLLLVSFANAQVPAGQLCPPLTGTVPEYYGSGECSGNNFRSYDLSYVHPGMFLYYNSLLNNNLVDLAKSFTLSEVTFISLGTSKQFYVTGDGAYIELELRTTGSLSGKYVAKDRNLLADYFVRDNANQITQYEMNGTRYQHNLAWGTVYRLSRITSRIGATSDILTGTGSTKTIRLGPDSIEVIRNGVHTTIRRAAERGIWVKLTRDASSRLKTILYADGTKYEFVYKGTTNLMLSETLVSPKGTQSTKFVYDSKDRLINSIAQNGTALRITRDVANRTSKIITPNGQVTTTTYDANGFITSMKTTVVKRPTVVIDESTYSYGANGKFIFMTYPEGNKTIKIEGKYSPTDARLPVGYKRFEGITLVEEVDQLRSAYTWNSNMDTVKNGTGQILSQVEYVYENASYPHVLKTINFKEGEMKGSKRTYAYSGNLTTVDYFNKNGTKVLTRVFDKDMPQKETDLLAPSTSQLKEYTYDAKHQVKSVKLNGAEVASYNYDSEGRQTYYKNEKGDVSTFTYDIQGFLTKNEVTTPAGKTTITYVRALFPGIDKKVKTLTTTTAYPHETVTEVSEFNERGEVLKVSRNGVVVWEK